MKKAVGHFTSNQKLTGTREEVKKTGHVEVDAPFLALEIDHLGCIVGGPKK